MAARRVTVAALSKLAVKLGDHTGYDLAIIAGPSDPDKRKVGGYQLAARLRGGARPARGAAHSGDPGWYAARGVDPITSVDLTADQLAMVLLSMIEGLRLVDDRPTDDWVKQTRRQRLQAFLRA